MFFEKGNWLFEVIEQWSQFFRKDNWYTFNPIMIEFEDDRCMGGVECTVIVLGLGIRLRWNHTVTKQMADIQRMIEDISKEKD